MEGVLGVITIYMSMMTVLVWTPISAVVYLVGAVLGIGGVWMLNGVGVMGVIYTIVYIGGIAILFVFVIMMVTQSGNERRSVSPLLKGGVGILGGLWLGRGIRGEEEREVKGGGDEGWEVWGREVMETLGMVLYTEWLGLMVVGGILLLVMVGLKEMIKRG